MNDLSGLRICMCTARLIELEIPPVVSFFAANTPWLYRRRMKKLAGIVGGVETLSLFICAIFLSFAHTSGAQNASPSSSKALAITCLLFCLFALWCTWGLTRPGNWAHTPYLLVQVFVLIAGMTLAQATAVQIKLLSVCVLVVGFLGLVGWFGLIRKPRLSKD